MNVDVRDPVDSPPCFRGARGRAFTRARRINSATACAAPFAVRSADLEDKAHPALACRQDRLRNLPEEHIVSVCKREQPGPSVNEFLRMT